MYGKSIYGRAQYARGPTPGSGLDESYIDISRYVPQFVADFREMGAVYRTEGYELGTLQNTLRDQADQCFVKTATWGLLLWEKEYGIKTNLSLSYEQRREIILAKMRGQGTTTVEMIRNVAIAFSGGEVEVIEDNPHYHFTVRFVGLYGIPRNMQAFISMLEEIKPAHLGYSFEYRFVIWNELRPYDWDEMKPYTWDGIRVKEIIRFVRWGNIGAMDWDGAGGYTWSELKKIEEAKT